MPYDFNTADRQKNGFDLIPANTVLPLVMTIRPGGAGEQGWLKPSQSSDAQMLDCEFTVESGPYARRKVWQMFTVSGGNLDEHGESIGGKISRQSLRAILESARRIDPNDMSDTAMAGRRINGWQDFNGLVFWARIGVKKDKSGQYADKNRIACVLTPDMKDYGKMTEAPAGASVTGSGCYGASSPAAAAAPAPATAPVWAASPSPAASPGNSSPAASAQPAAPVVPSEAASPVPAWAR